MHNRSGTEEGHTIMTDLDESLEKMKEGIRESLEELRQKREELAVQIKLGSMELQEEWDSLENKMHEMEKKWHQFQREAELKETASSIGTAMTLLGAELKQGYQRVKDAL